MSLPNAYRERLRSAQEAASLIRDRDDIFLPLAPGQPVGLLAALGERPSYEQLTLYCGLLMEPFTVATRPGVRIASGFFGPIERFLAKQGGAVDYVPSDFHGFELLAMRQKARVVSAVVSPPDAEGYLSFGLHAGATDLPFLQAAGDPTRLTIAEVNPRMPATRGLPEFGDHRVHCSKVDVIIEHEHPLISLPDEEPTSDEIAIAGAIADLIPDGATLQFGIGAVPNEIAKILARGSHGDFGIHTELLVDGVRLLHEAGKVTNRKGFYDGLTVCTFALGSEALYAWASADPTVRFLPVSAINVPSAIKRNRRMVSMNGALAIDLHGQVVADSLAGRQYSGVGGHESFVTGAREAEEGISICCMHSTVTVGGERRSTIVARLEPGSIVTTPRHQVQYVATEHGVAHLAGLTDRERATALIGIAAPEFRDSLRAARAG
jgi:acyl-CoA hydrolase